MDVGLRPLQLFIITGDCGAFSKFQGVCGAWGALSAAVPSDHSYRANPLGVDFGAVLRDLPVVDKLPWLQRDVFDLLVVVLSRFLPLLGRFFPHGFMDEFDAALHLFNILPHGLVPERVHGQV